MPSDPNRLTVTADATRSSPGVSAIHSRAVVYQSQGFSTDTDSPRPKLREGVWLRTGGWSRTFDWYI